MYSKIISRGLDYSGEYFCQLNRRRFIFEFKEDLTQFLKKDVKCYRVDSLCSRKLRNKY